MELPHVVCRGGCHEVHKVSSGNTRCSDSFHSAVLQPDSAEGSDALGPSQGLQGSLSRRESLGAGDLWRSFVKALRPSPFLPWLQLLGGAHGPLRSQAKGHLAGLILPSPAFQTSLCSC